MATAFVTVELAQQASVCDVSEGVWCCLFLVDWCVWDLCCISLLYLPRQALGKVVTFRRGALFVVVLELAGVRYR